MAVFQILANVEERWRTAEHVDNAISAVRRDAELHSFRTFIKRVVVWLQLPATARRTVLAMVKA